MKNQNQRALEKHWADQAKKRTPAEQLRFKAEKLRKQIEKSKSLSDRGGEEPAAPENSQQVQKDTGKARKKPR
jgi:hypothetical protein